MIKKISMIGCGHVGATAAFQILNRTSPAKLALIDTAGGRAAGIGLDLEDTRGILGFPTKILAGTEAALAAESDIVIVTAGLPRKQGMTRADLYEKNKLIIESIVKPVAAASPDAIFILVTNPLDLITRVAVRASGLPRTRVFGMGSSLDTSRMMNILSQKSGISAANIGGFVFGAHSKDMVVNPERIHIEGTPLPQLFPAQDLDELRTRVQQRGAEIVGHLKTGSAHFAPAAAISQLVEAIAADGHRIFPVSVLLNGEFGRHDVCMGAPCVISRQGIERILEFELSEGEHTQLRTLMDAFREV
ncbi:MAG: malate dehydrogenase [Candidatus Omnitrophica bacterium]|nr:malate dehydrogenase [Candidatus Omnitrophota bacterium]